MEMSMYQEQARRTQNKYISAAEREKHAVFGMASEAGEICGIYQKGLQGHPFSADDAIKELGDLLWFAAEYADCMGVSLDEVAQRNIDKLRKRYPDGFDVEHSVHREAYE